MGREALSPRPKDVLRFLCSAGCGCNFHGREQIDYRVLIGVFVFNYRIVPQSDRGFSQYFSLNAPQSDRGLRPKVIVEKFLTSQPFVHCQT